MASASSLESLEPTYQQLQRMKLDKSPFVVVSVIGQELLTAGHHGASVVVLEAALKIGTCSLKLRGSVFSALSSAYWSLGNAEKSSGYMQQDLDVAKTLGKPHDVVRVGGQCHWDLMAGGGFTWVPLFPRRLRCLFVHCHNDCFLGVREVMSRGHLQHGAGHCGPARTSEGARV